MTGILEKMCAADVIAVATPVYFGMPSDLFRKFIMRTRVLRHQDFPMANKPVGIMAIAGRRSGGAETTILSCWLPFIRHGCLIVGNGGRCDLPVRNDGLGGTLRAHFVRRMGTRTGRTDRPPHLRSGEARESRQRRDRSLSDAVLLHILTDRNPGSQKNFLAYRDLLSAGLTAGKEHLSATR